MLATMQALIRSFRYGIRIMFSSNYIYSACMLCSLNTYQKNICSLNSYHTRIRKVWDMVPLCVFWCIWWERNTRCFEGMERNVLELKGLVLRTLMEWSKAAGVLVFSSALDFLESCNA